MYFNLIALTPGRERQAARERHDRGRGREDSYGDHQWLWHFFPAPKGSRRDFLFRREEASSLPRFYAVSERPARSPSATWAVRTQEYYPRLKAGDRLRFVLRANPVVSVRMPDKKTIRHDAVMYEKKRLLAEKGLQKWADLPRDERPPLYGLVRQTCGAWLEKRAAKKGFIFHPEDGSFSVDAYQPLKLYATLGKKHDEDIKFSSVDFSGILTVTDPEIFQKALMEGIGPAKAFGCGLLLVRPL
jgi:CRISPR system Cascade subunit CasE